MKNTYTPERTENEIPQTSEANYSPQTARNKVFLTNKYIGVYQGKFGILSKKTEVPTKAEVSQRQIEYQAKFWAQHKPSLEKTPSKQAETHKSPSKLIANLNIDNTRKSVNNLSKYRRSRKGKLSHNSMVIQSAHLQLSRSKNNRSMKMILYPTDKQKKAIRKKMKVPAAQALRNKFTYRAKSAFGIIETEYPSNSNYESISKNQDSVVEKPLKHAYVESKKASMEVPNYIWYIGPASRNSRAEGDPG